MAAMDRLILLDADTVIVDDVCAAHEVFYELAPGVLVGFAPEMTLWYIDKPAVGLHISSNHRYIPAQSRYEFRCWILASRPCASSLDAWHPLLVQGMRYQNMTTLDLGDQDVFNLISNQKPGWFDILSWEWNLQLAVCQHYPHDEALNVLLPQAKIVHGSDGHFNKHAGSLIEHVYEAFAVDSRSVARMASIKTMVVMVIWSFAGVAFD
ncbi:TPA: Glycosyltransferase-like 1B [Trebouxia sp. C0004]